MKNNNDNFFIFLSCSIALHLVLIYFFLFGLPSFFEKLPEEEVITFEILPVSSISNVQTQKKSVEKPIENEDAKKVEQALPSKIEETKPVEEKILPKDTKPEEIIEEKPKIEEKKPVPDPTPKVVEAEKVIEKKPLEEKKVPEKKVEKKIEKKPKEVKKKKEDYSDLDSLLKNLEESSEGENSKSNKKSRAKTTDEKKESKGKFNQDSPLSISEKALIQQQIKRHWNDIPPGALGNDNIKISLHISLDKQGNVLQVEMHEKVCPGISTSICEALVSSVKRAVWKATPIENLDPSRYDIWKEFNFSFYPNKL